MKRQLRAIGPAEKATRGVLAGLAKGPYMRGTGHTDWICPQCGRVLLEKMGPGEAERIRNAAFTCSGCGTVSSPEPAPN